MHIDYTPEQKALRRELRDYYAKLITPEVRAKLAAAGREGSPASREIVRQIGKDGWLGVGWPVEYGGQGRTGIEQQIWFEETRRAGAPLPFVTLNTVGPALMARGSDAQKEKFLKPILAGSVHFAIGYTEPESGTDLASLKTSAVREGDHYVVNGTKIFTSGANGADYIWLACRTDPDASKHRGISILIVDTKLPGFSHSPIHTVGGGTTSMSYYDNVRVPVDMLVGRENGGWELITLQLNHERMGLAAFGSGAYQILDDVIEWARETESDTGQPLIEKPWVQAALAESYARIEAIKVMNWKMAWELENGKLDPADASAAKVYGSETLIEVYRLLLEVLGVAGTVQDGSPGALLRGRLEAEWRGCQINTFGGGVNEIQRDIVATLGLGLPRERRG
jgi:alkylation response protein AidB-like acyl-CoA dehydrogenase